MSFFLGLEIRDWIGTLCFFEEREKEVHVYLTVQVVDGQYYLRRLRVIM